MIPTRNFPYTDYHDLNLDFLLRQFQQYEVDIEELKRRVKALEDWKDITDPRITTIESDVTTIKDDIVTINNRLNIDEENILKINNFFADAVKTIKIQPININDEANFYLDGYYATNNADFNKKLYHAFIDFKNESPLDSNIRVGNGANVIGYDNNGDMYNIDKWIINGTENSYTLDIYVDYIDIGHYFHIHHVISGSTHTQTREYIKKETNFDFRLDIPGSSNWTLGSDPDYPYEITIPVNSNFNPDALNFTSNMRVEEEDEVRIYFNDYDEFIEWSNIICPFVECIDPDITVESGKYGYLKLRANSNLPTASIYPRINVYVTKDNTII